MAENLVLHHCTLAMGTEGNFEGGDDVCVPHWPGYNSGVSIGLGFDIGASDISKTELESLFGSIGVPPKMTELMAKGEKVLGEAAGVLLEKLELRNYVRFTRQQVLDLYQVVKMKFLDKTRRCFPQSYGIMHDAIIEVLTKLCYGAPAIVMGWKSKSFAGLGPLYDAKMQQLAGNTLAQFDLAIAMMEAVVAANLHSVHSKSAKGMKAFLEKMRAVIKAGGSVEISYAPTTPEALAAPDNKTIETAGFVAAHTYPGKDGEPNVNYAQTAFKNQLLASAQKELAAMQKVCANAGCSLPPLGAGTKMTEAVFQAGVEAYCGINVQVQRAQEQLVKLGYFQRINKKGMANADGVWGDVSAGVLRQFQQENQLTPSGELDAATLQALAQAKTPINTQPQPTPASPNPDLELYKNAFGKGKGSLSDSVGTDGKNKGKDVIILRGLLFFNKYLPQNIQTVLGTAESRAKYSKSDAELEAAVRLFQLQQLGIRKPDGRVDAGGDTLKALNGINTKITAEEPALQVKEVAADAAVFGCFN